MTIQNFNYKQFLTIMFPTVSGDLTLGTAATINALSSHVAVIFQAPRTGNVVKMYMRLGAVTTGATMKMTLETLDSSTPRRPSGTVINNGTFDDVVTTGNANSIRTASFSGTLPAVVQGSEYAACYRSGPDGTVPNLVVSRLAFGASQLPYAQAVINGTPSIPHTSFHCLALEYENGEIYEIPGCILASSVANQGYSSSNNPNEYGNVWTPEADTYVDAFWGHLGGGSAAQEPYFEIRDAAGTLQRSQLVDAAARGSTNRGTTLITLATPYLFPAGVKTYFTVRANTTTAININYMDFISNNMLNSCFLGKNCFGVTRNGGAFSEINTRKYMLFPLTGGVDIPSGGGGSNIIIPAGGLRGGFL